MTSALRDRVADWLFLARAGDILDTYRYTGVGAALSRYFQLQLGLMSTRNMPMNEDDTIKGTRMSGDSNAMIEYLDIGSCLKGLSELECVTLELEYTWQILAPEHPKAASKTDAVEVRCGQRITAAGFEMIVMQATDWVRQQMEGRGWIPKSKRTSPLYNRLRRVGNR